MAKLQTVLKEREDHIKDQELHSKEIKNENLAMRLKIESQMAEIKNNEVQIG